MPKEIKFKEALEMFTCGCCQELLASKVEIEKILAERDELEDELFWRLKDHFCTKAPPRQLKLAVIRTRCFRCGEGIREGLPYIMAHLRHNYPDGRVADSPREFHPRCFDRFVLLGKGGRSKVTYQVLSKEEF